MRTLLALVLAMSTTAGCADDAPIEPSTDADAPPAPRVSLSPDGRMEVLLNAYYLQEEATRALRSGTEPAHVDETLRKLSGLGVTLVRTNAFNDDPAKVGDTTIQIDPLVFDEVALHGLDVVLARAHASGLRLVLPLGNYWDDFGGTRQYCRWAGLPDPKRGDARFFTDPNVRALYLAWISALLNRVSTVDGIRYGDHPAVFAWELLNEPRGDGLSPDGAQMRAWVDAVASHVKSLAPTHRVAVGEEGFETSFAGHDEAFWRDAGRDWMFRSGSSFALNTASPWIDVATVHLYPDGWSFPRRLVTRGATRWISEHAAIARGLGKPLLVEELGLRDDGMVPLLEDRRAWMRAVFDAMRTTGAAGGGPWQFAYDARPADDYTFRWLDGTAPDDPRNAYADLVQQLAATR